MNPTQYMPQQQYGPPPTQHNMSNPNQPYMPAKSPGMPQPGGGYPPNAQNYPAIPPQQYPQNQGPTPDKQFPPSQQPPQRGNQNFINHSQMPGMPPMPGGPPAANHPQPNIPPGNKTPIPNANQPPVQHIPPGNREIPSQPGGNMPPMPGNMSGDLLGNRNQTNPNQLTQQMGGLNINKIPPGGPNGLVNGNEPRFNPQGNQMNPMPPHAPLNPNLQPGQPGYGSMPQQPPIQGMQGGYQNMPPMPQQHNLGPGQRAMPGQFVNGAQPFRPGMPPQPPMSGPMMGGGMNYNQPPMPPMPGAYPQTGQSGPYQQQNDYMQQPQQSRRLDPDQMPSPIQVMVEDQNSRSGVFSTELKGQVPPLVTTKFITQDQGNSSPRFIRSTMYNIPVTVDMMKQANIPFGLLISPFARTVEQEFAPPIVDFGELGPVRCIRCKAYMSPYMQFIDGGRRFQCLFCKATTEVPTEYFQHLDHNGKRVDRYERPELVLGTYEFVATKDYCRNSVIPKPPAMIFVIDVSYNNVKSGLVHLLCAEMKNIIQNLPVDQGESKSKMKVGFITYNKTVHFYNVKGNLAQPQMLVVGDVQDMFMPLLDGFLCDVDESEIVINALTQQIPAIFQDTRETETVLLPAIQAGLEALKASECPGKLLIFHSSLPIAEAPGKLKNRDDRKLLATDKERTILTPQNNVYNNLGQECVQAGCSVDLFVCNNSYIDLATIGQVSRLTGGEIYKYTYFQADTDGPRLIRDVISNISRPIGFDAIMRVRTSTGVRPTEFYGHFFMSNTTDIELASIDCNKAIALEIKHDDKLTGEDGVYIQAALLYTSCSGQRRLRIINLALNTCTQYSDLYRSCDLDAIMNYYGKQSVHRLLEHSPKAVKDGLVQRCAQTLACYRKHCAGPSTAGQLILPECMKLMPLYLNCLLRNDSISGGSDMTVDDRTYVMHCLLTMDVATSVAFLYPRLIPVHDLEPDSSEIPMSIRCSSERMVDNGAYILENGIHMFFWVGLGVSTEFVQSLFGVPSVAQANFELIELPILDNPFSKRIRALIDDVRAERPHCMRLTLVRQRDKLETVFRHFLVEDRGTDGSPCYVDFLCHLHKEIRAVMS